ncbi:MAG: hypothetical protein ACTSQJ_13930 [Promethearchaeota archaeon]
MNDVEVLTLMTELLIIFTVLTTSICIILLIQIIKAEKIARPFLFSLFIYFFFLSVANIFQIIHNFNNFDLIINEFGINGIYTTYIVFTLTFAAPIFLIYQIEKKFFPDLKIHSKYHLFSLTSLILFIIFNIIVVYSAAFLNYEIYPNFKIGQNPAIFIVIPLFTLEFLYIIVAFFYLGYKSVGKYRKYAYFVSLGWLTNNIANVITTLFYVVPSSQNLYFIAKFIGVIIVAYCLYSFYTLKEK